VRLEELDYPFFAELIAQRPAEPRDLSRLLVLDAACGGVRHRRFRDLPSLLRKGDLLVVNDSRVLPARIHALKPTGGVVELVFLRPCGGEEGGRNGTVDTRTWEVLAKRSRRLREGSHLRVVPAPGFRGHGEPEVVESSGGEPVGLYLEASLGEGRWLVRLPADTSAQELMEAHGELPLPPYIRTPLRTASDYQTVYASQPGSAAAPTAGLHFTSRVLRELEEAGIERATVTLHVGLDTFRPLSGDTVEDHPIHTEFYTVPPQEAARIDRIRAEGRRVVAVGTTTVRVLETLYRHSDADGPPSAPLSGATDLFITPGFAFRAVDALISNFHLPRTSLLALVMAFAGVDHIRSAYAEAVKERYRFFSFGDAMLIDSGPRAARASAGERV
jgi:S-adenosylmethionine:tRNA ribosyltransferase-isomerase